MNCVWHESYLIEAELVRKVSARLTVYAKIGAKLITGQPRPLRLYPYSSSSSIIPILRACRFNRFQDSHSLLVCDLDFSSHHLLRSRPAEHVAADRVAKPLSFDNTSEKQPKSWE